MSDPVNLNRYRKIKARVDQKTRADQNAVKFGRSKAEKTNSAVLEEIAHKRHKRHEIIKPNLTETRQGEHDD